MNELVLSLSSDRTQEHTKRGVLFQSPYKSTPILKEFPEPNSSRYHQHENLSVSVLKTPADRLKIAHLRQYAAFGIERDLAPNLLELEDYRDTIGMVFSINLGHRTVATIRFVPTGYGVTCAEKICRNGVCKELFNSNSWEVGRLVVAPEDRNSTLLSKSMALVLGVLMETICVSYFHATTTMPLAPRLYRRFGFKTESIFYGKSGAPYALIVGNIRDVASALQSPLQKVDLLVSECL